ncbi:recombinase family protein [Streptomyces sp. NBC_01381]|uniref:recombinase family protein n=1 Tax=Streptomyces sp. NBC_01381 TaxID=2903845 RepID=UPI00225360D7|nr:recombinase family protein [Streptomyces sp. NBC_01381]MCX4665600.1 recombinase family protein [Streptomyces sp. NBC_01381]
METSSSRKPQHAGGYVRISLDPTEEEKGVTRQREDVEQLAKRLGWTVGKIYPENDTSAYKRKRIELPDGRHVWRVIRPEFRQMLKDYQDGAIDGIIVYDLDRLARQPRDLEDLIDLVDHYRRPVAGVTGSLDLMTENGKAMARVLMAMANKSSADTARRVSRERLQRAQEGLSLPPTRAFGWQVDRRTREPGEAELIRKGIVGFTDGESWSSVTRMFTDSGIAPVRAKQWYLTTVRNMLLSPRTAGIVPYWGRGRIKDGEQDGADAVLRRSPISRSPRDLALRDADGAFVMGSWEPIVTVEQWEAFVTEYERRKEGLEFTPSHTKKYLLSGLLRCARPKEDGTPCGRAMVGKSIKHHRSGKQTRIYCCPGKNLGGCGGSQRGMAQVDQLIEDLLFLHLESNQPDAKDDQPDRDWHGDDAVIVELADVQGRLKMMREGMRDGRVSPESFFAVVPGLETQERQLTSALNKARRVQVDRDQRLKSPDQVRADWESATVPGKRAILGQFLQAVMVHPARPLGHKFDHEAFAPVWKPMPH